MMVVILFPASLLEAPQWISEHRIPFVVREPDAVYSAKNMKFLEEGIAALNAGKGVAHELIDEED